MSLCVQVCKRACAFLLLSPDHTCLCAFSYSGPLGLSYLLQPIGWTLGGFESRLKQFPPYYFTIFPSFFLRNKPREKEGKKRERKNKKNLFSLGEKAEMKEDHLPIARIASSLLFFFLLALCFLWGKKNLFFDISFKRSLWLSALFVWW